MRLFDGLPSLKARMRSALDEMGFSATLASAATARAALWLARGECKKLEEVPLEAACHEEDLSFLKSIGIATLGELMRLPREGLARRCSRTLLDELDCALGGAPEPRPLFDPPPRFSAKLELPAQVTHAQGLVFAARRLLVQLEGLLAARQAGIRAFTLVLIDEQTQSDVDVHLASPARDTERLAQLLHEKLARLKLERPVEAIRIEAEHFSPLHGITATMFGDEGAQAEDWARLLERLRARLGHDAVCGLATHPDHRPEHAWRRVEPGEWDPHEFRQPGPRPLWLLEPRKLEEGQFELLAGPERIESGWWDGDEAGRDYFAAKFKNATVGWIYRETGEWFLHGLFA